VASLASAQTGSIGFYDAAGGVTDSDSNLALATTFTIGDFNSNKSPKGVFTPSSLQSGVDFGTYTFSLTNPAGLDINNTVFGTFTCTGISVIGIPTSSEIELAAIGYYSSGSWDEGAPIIHESASFDISFVDNGSVSDGASFSIPAAVPEPGSLALLGMGATALSLGLRRRKA
jgi:hypothetical protein